MKKKILIGFTILAMGAIVFTNNFQSKDKTGYNLLLDNLEALASSEGGGNWKTCYHVNVTSPMGEPLLHCGTCKTKVGHGLPSALCP